MRTFSYAPAASAKMKMEIEDLKRSGKLFSWSGQGSEGSGQDQEFYPPGGASQALKTGVPKIDRLSGGGLPMGSLTEFITRSSGSGGQSLLLALIREAMGARGLVSLIDAADTFDPQSVSDEVRAHLLWVRCRDGRSALQATDLAVRDGNFILVALDLRGMHLCQLGKIPSAVWYRFQRILKKNRVCLVVLTPVPRVVSAHFRFRLDHTFSLSDLEKPQSMLLGKVRVEVLRCRWRITEGFKEEALTI